MQEGERGCRLYILLLAAKGGGKGKGLAAPPAAAAPPSPPSLPRLGARWTAGWLARERARPSRLSRQLTGKVQTLLLRYRQVVVLLEGKGGRRPESGLQFIVTSLQQCGLYTHTHTHHKTASPCLARKPIDDLLLFNQNRRTDP